MNALRTAPTGLHAGAPLSTVPAPDEAESGAAAGNAAAGNAPTLAQVFELAGADLAQAEVELKTLLQSTVPAVPEIASYLADAGGKRLRPLLTALGAGAVGHPGPLARLMCVGELLHLGSLLHDDVVDDGAERRGQPAAQHVYGNPAVILTGDFCLARAVLLAADEGGYRAVTELGRTITAMAEGEVLQLLNAGNLDLDLDTYLQVVDKKSAALIAWCAAAGAWAVEDDAAADALRRYGHAVGVAFQVTDDVLDYVGEKRLTGKRRGQDLAERKMTLPLVLAMQQAPELRERLRKGPPSPERIPAIIGEVRATGACDRALDFAHERVQEGIDALSALPDGQHRSGLLTLAHYLVDRVQ